MSHGASELPVLLHTQFKSAQGPQGEDRTRSGHQGRWPDNKFGLHTDREYGHENADTSVGRFLLSESLAVSFLAPTLPPLLPVFPSCGQMCLHKVVPHLPSPASNPESRGFDVSTLQLVRSCCARLMRAPACHPTDAFCLRGLPCTAIAAATACDPRLLAVNDVTLLCFLLTTIRNAMFSHENLTTCQEKFFSKAKLLGSFPPMMTFYVIIAKNGSTDATRLITTVSKIKPLVFSVQVRPYRVLGRRYPTIISLGTFDAICDRFS
jgi:hypothetical protein